MIINPSHQHNFLVVTSGPYFPGRTTAFKIGSEWAYCSRKNSFGQHGPAWRSLRAWGPVGADKTSMLIITRFLRLQVCPPFCFIYEMTAFTPWPACRTSLSSSRCFETSKAQTVHQESFNLVATCLLERIYTVEHFWAIDVCAASS